MNDKGKFVWKKKPGKENHLFDCRLYANVVRDILQDEMFSAHKIKNGVWKDYVNLVL